MLIGTKACFVLFSTNGNLGGQQNFSVPSAFEKIVFRKQIASTRVKYSFLKRTNPTTRTQPHRSHKGNCCIPVHRMHTLSSMHVFSFTIICVVCTFLILVLLIFFFAFQVLKDRCGKKHPVNVPDFFISRACCYYQTDIDEMIVDLSCMLFKFSYNMR